MSRYPHLLSECRKGTVLHHTDIGLDLLLEEMGKAVPDSPVRNPRLSQDRIRGRLGRWVLGFETDPAMVLDRQEVMRYLLAHPEGVAGFNSLFVLQPSEREDTFSHYAGMVRRFDSFAESVASLTRLLEGGILPKRLVELRDACRATEARIQGVRSLLNPEYELRIEARGRYVRDLFGDRRLKCDFTYVLANRANQSLKRGTHRAEFGLPGYYEKRDSFLDDLETRIEGAMERALGKTPFYKMVFSVTGALRYDVAENRTEGDFQFRRKREEGVFPVSFRRGLDNTPKSIVELARFTHNYDVLIPMEGEIQEFEDLLVDLKALAAAALFLSRLGERGFPLTFPEVVQDPSISDLAIRGLYHPLLAHALSGPVVANDVETTVSRNIRLITGANNNGKTCYMDALGISQILFQAGMPVLADAARMRLKDKVLTHYVRSGDIKAGQSRFAHECSRILELIDLISKDSLILCDEMFTGTAPQDGEIVSRLVLEMLIRTGATLFFTTHYHGIGDQLRDSPCAASLCCKLDHTTTPPSYTYRIEPGISRESDGLVVAAQFGIHRDHLTALLMQKERGGVLRLR